MLIQKYFLIRDIERLEHNQSIIRKKLGICDNNFKELVHSSLGMIFKANKDLLPKKTVLTKICKRYSTKIRLKIGRTTVLYA